MEFFDLGRWMAIGVYISYNCYGRAFWAGHQRAIFFPTCRAGFCNVALALARYLRLVYLRLHEFLAVDVIEIAQGASFHQICFP